MLKKIETETCACKPMYCQYTVRPHDDFVRLPSWALQSHAGCGGEGEPCCDSVSCLDEDLVCDSGVCERCGATYDQCCEGDACRNDAPCGAASGLCLPVVIGMFSCSAPASMISLPERLTPVMGLWHTPAPPNMVQLCHVRIHVVY